MAHLGRIAFIAVLLLLLAACRGGSSPSGGRDGEPAPVPSTPVSITSGCGRAHAPGLSLEEMTSSGVKRTYRLYVPRGYAPAKRPALVPTFHGFQSNAAEQDG